MLQLEDHSWLRQWPDLADMDVSDHQWAANVFDFNNAEFDQPDQHRGHEAVKSLRAAQTHIQALLAEGGAQLIRT